MSKKIFIPFYEVKNHVGDVLVVDAHHPQGFDLSHWRGAPIPEGCAADTSTEIVLKAIEKNLPELEKEYVTNNHFDIDGFLGIWSLFNPELALQHKDLLIEMAQLSDFREINFLYANWKRALKIVCWLNKEEAEKFYPPFGASEIAEKEMDACVPKFNHFLNIFADVLEQPTDDIYQTDEYDLVLNQIAQQPQKVDIDFIRLHIVSNYSPLHYYCSYEGSQSSDMVLSQYADNRYELECKYTTWVQTTRKHFPRIDLKPLAHRLNEVEKSDFAWDVEHFTDTAPILRLRGKDLSKKERYSNPMDRPIYTSSIGPETFKSICIDYFSHYYEMIQPTTETISWQELRQLNEDLFNKK